MDKNLRELQLCELDILKEVVKICNRHNLTYYMMGGTFLGAIRHKGFIPWDDDVDISLNREEYDKLLEILPKELPNNYKIDNFLTNKDSLIYATRVENSLIKVKDNSASIKKIRNAWIDIFPLDGMPNNTIIRKLHEFRLLYLRLKFKYSTFSETVTQNKKDRSIHEKILVTIGNYTKIEKILDKNKCLKDLDKALRKYEYKNSNYVVNFMGAYKFKEMFKKAIYEKYKLYDFENTKLNAPENYNFVLTQMYGNYMQIPQKDMQNKHCIEVIKE
ncbi:MAG: LicD family protein [Bacilli bacterium]|nr:LicD family protein [Bacilli bacterium]